MRVLERYLEKALGKESEEPLKEDAVSDVYKRAYKKFKVKSFSELKSDKDKSKALDFLDKELLKIIKGKSPFKDIDARRQ